MATVNDPDNAVIRLNVIMRSGDTDDPGFLADMGREVLRVYNECAFFTRQTDKACKGQVTVIFDFKASRSEGEEVEVDVSMQPVKTKSPPKTFARKKRTFAGHDGEISTVPTQVELPIMGIKGSVDGGKKDAPEAQKAKVV
jgi:hypothetical protein